MTYVEDSVDSITVSVASPFMKNTMDSKGYFKIVEKKLEETIGQKIKIICIINNEKSEEKTEKDIQIKPEKKSSKPNFTKDLKTDSILDEFKLQNPPSESEKNTSTPSRRSHRKDWCSRQRLTRSSQATRCRSSEQRSSTISWSA